MNEREVKQPAATIEILLGNVQRLEVALSKIIKIGSGGHNAKNTWNDAERVDMMIEVAEKALNE